MLERLVERSKVSLLLPKKVVRLLIQKVALLNAERGLIV